MSKLIASGADLRLFQMLAFRGLASSTGLDAAKRVTLRLLRLISTDSILERRYISVLGLRSSEVFLVHARSENSSLGVGGVLKKHSTSTLPKDTCFLGDGPSATSCIVWTGTIELSECRRPPARGATWDRP